MACTHPRDVRDESAGLPCAWPGCPDGTPKETVALLHGDSGALRKRMPGPRYEVESTEGVTLHRRRRTGTGWAWEPVG